MPNTFLDNKISSFIEDKFPEFVRTDHPVFVEFLKLYYQFLETAKLTLTNVQAQDNILLENLLTENFVLLEDGTKIYTEDSEYGAFEKGETVTGQTSGAVSTILAEDNNNSILYIEQNRFLRVGEVVVGSSSGARGTISKYQGNPVQTIQQLLEYANIDKTITDFLDQFRDAYLTAIPNTLASGVSKRNLVKNIRDLYRAKGTRKGHELFFRLLFDETPEIFYPRENLLKISAGEWTSNTVVRVVATNGNPNSLSGQVITQTVDATINASAATATVETVLQLQEGETTVFELILNLESINGTFVKNAEITGVDNQNPDVAVTATVQLMVTGASVTNGASFYDVNDTVTVESVVGNNATISIVDVGSGSVQEIAIDNPGTGYEVGQDLFFDNTNTEGVGASAKIVNVGGAVSPESGDTTDHTVTGNITDGSDTVTNITTNTLYAARQFDLTGRVTTGSTTITEITTTQLVVGATIEGTGIPANTTISSIDVVGNDHNGTITISAAVTHGGINGSISSITRSGSTATVTTSSAHGLDSQDTVTITGATPTSYNGIKNINVTSNTQFTYTVDSSVSTPAGGTKTFTLASKTRTLLHLEEETGQAVQGPGIPATTIRKIVTAGSSNNGTIQLAANATATTTGVTITVPSEYVMTSVDHILFEEGTERGDAYTGGQQQLETQTFTDLGVASESNEIVNVLMFSGGSGYERVPTVIATDSKIFWSTTAATTTGTFKAGEVITNQNNLTANIAVLGTGNASIANATGTFLANDVITGATSGARATLYSVSQHGTGATFIAWSNDGLGAIKGLEVTNFGTGYTSSPTVIVPTKMLVTRRTGSTPPDVSLSSSFTVGDTITGQQSSATAEVISWDNTRQLLTLKILTGTFILGELIDRGSITNYAIVSRQNTASLTASIGTLGTTAGAFENDKGKVSESLMKIQDSFYYQDFSYVVRVGSAIADWRGSVKKAVHPAGFALFGEVSIATQVAARMTTPITGITSVTPELASLFEAVLTTIVRRKLGTFDDGTSLASETQIRGTTDTINGGTTLKRGGDFSGHEVGLIVGITEATASGTTVTLKTDGEHGIQVNEEIQLSGITTVGYDGNYTVSTVTSDTITFTRSKTLTVTKITRTGSVATATTTNHSGLFTGLSVVLSGSSVSQYNDTFTITSISGTEFTFNVTGTPADVLSASITLNLANLSTPAVVPSSAKITLTRAFDKDTRDVSVRSIKDITIQAIYSGFDSLRKNRYGLGATKKTATKYLWATSYTTEDTAPVRQTDFEYAYPNMTRRKVPETGTDNVDAGGTGVYDSTFNYTTIQIGVHEINSQMTLESFADVPINEIMRSAFLTDEIENGNHDDIDYILFEDGGKQVMEHHVTIPRESNKLWNVPPPSYIRGVNVATGEYVSFDDNTSPPDFSDNTAPPSFDGTTGV